MPPELVASITAVLGALAAWIGAQARQNAINKKKGDPGDVDMEALRRQVRGEETLAMILKTQDDSTKNLNVIARVLTSFEAHVDSDQQLQSSLLRALERIGLQQEHNKEQIAKVASDITTHSTASRERIISMASDIRRLREVFDHERGRAGGKGAR